MELQTCLKITSQFTWDHTVSNCMRGFRWQSQIKIREMTPLKTINLKEELGVDTLKRF